MRRNRWLLTSGLWAALGACTLSAGCKVSTLPNGGCADGACQAALDGSHPEEVVAAPPPAVPPSVQAVQQTAMAAPSASVGRPRLTIETDTAGNRVVAGLQVAAPLPDAAPHAPPLEMLAPHAEVPLAAGCANGNCGGTGGAGSPLGPVPRELIKINHPEYRVEPPDILLLDAVRMSTIGAYRLEAGDALQVVVPEALPGEEIRGVFVVDPDGYINLGPAYGPARVGGMTTEEARAAIETALKAVLKQPKSQIALAAVRGFAQAVRGEHLVRPDGTVGLGIYGSINVTNMTLQEVRCAIEKKLACYGIRAELSVDVLGFNHQVYYVIYDGGGYGQSIYRLPITGNETVLDAIAQLNGLPTVASKRRIWVARPAPPGHPCDQVLPVDWNAITQGGSTATNHQLFPGDRVVVKADKFIAADNWIAKFAAPIERILGLALLGSSTVNSFSGQGIGNNGGF